MTRLGRVVALVSTTWMLALAAGVPVVEAHGGKDDLEIRTLSTRAELVSGGDALVEVTASRGVSLRDVRVSLNGRDVTGAFERDRSGDSLVGLVEGLRLGTNWLEARVHRGKGRDRGHGPSASLKLVNHPVTGPVLSGPQQQPFICETEAFGLGPALDADCSVETRVEYLYRSTDGTFKPFDAAGPRPADLRRTTTSEGRTVDFVVRFEQGTINRAVYQIAFLHQPGTPLPDPWTTTPGWNGRLLYTFGGGCAAGYHQGQTTGGVLDTALVGDRGLADGYALAASSLNVFGTKCDDVISAETMMMVKEHFIKQFGLPRHTIGLGSSGGSMQIHLISHNYPGLLNGILPTNSFPDTLTFSVPYIDCALLDHAFAGATQPWTLEQKAAVAGHRTYDYCTRNVVWSTRLTDPTQLCDPAVPPALIYDPVTNPTGARCTLYDDMINVYGKDPHTGFARRPLDNVGVQYGLSAFNAGAITAEQFLELNALIGGHDVDGLFVPERTEADRTALRIAYRTGRVNSGEGLDAIPMIDLRNYLDEVGDVHDSSRSRVMRARLFAANGHADNQVIIVIHPTSPRPPAYYETVRQMDAWLTRIGHDTSRRSAAQKVARNKPAGLVDACYTAAGEKITDPAVCRQLYPPQLNPRLAAGEPMTNDVFKCRLKPVDRRDYTRPLTSAQLKQLKTIFRTGVCDYSKPGVEQQPRQGTWRRY